MSVVPLTPKIPCVSRSPLRRAGRRSAVRSTLIALAGAIVLGACSGAGPYDSESLRRMLPVVEADRAASVAGTPLSLVEIRETALEVGAQTSIGASRGPDNLSVETISDGGVRRVFAMLDGDACLFAVVDTGASPVVVNWVLVDDIYTAVDVVPSGACSASAYFGIDLAGIELSRDPASPTRLG